MRMNPGDLVVANHTQFFKGTKEVSLRIHSHFNLFLYVPFSTVFIVLSVGNDILVTDGNVVGFIMPQLLKRLDA